MDPTRIVAAHVAALVALTGRVALAQEAPADAARRALIAQAEGASDASDHARALELAARAAALRMTPSLRLLIAQEHRALGHALDALDAAARCTDEAQADATIRNRERILASCAELTASLRTRVARLTVRVEPPVEGVRVQVGGRPLDAARLGAAHAVLPGRVSLVAEAEGRPAFRRELDLAPGGEQTVVVVLAAGEAPQRDTALASPPPRVAAARARGPGAGPWILAGAGALGVGAGVAFWQLQEQSVAARDAACAARSCQASARDDDARARTWNLATNVAYGVGAAAMIGGVVWWLVARPSRDDRRAAWSVGAAPVAQGMTVTVGGTM